MKKIPIKGAYSTYKKYRGLKPKKKNTTSTYDGTNATSTNVQENNYQNSKKSKNGTKNRVKSYAKSKANAQAKKVLKNKVGRKKFKPGAKIPNKLKNPLSSGVNPMSSAKNIASSAGKTMGKAAGKAATTALKTGVKAGISAIMKHPYVLIAVVGVILLIILFLNLGIIGGASNKKKIGSSSGGFNIRHTVLTEDEFVEAIEKYINGEGAHLANSYNKYFKPYIRELYRLCEEKTINPEFAFVTAITETSLNGGMVNNYTCFNVPNGDSIEQHPFSSLLEHYEAFCDHIIQNFLTPGTWHYEEIVNRYNARKEAGCDKNGYGMPDTLQGIQSLYSWLGDHVTGSAGERRILYIRPCCSTE